MSEEMTLNEFVDKLQEIRARNGWTVTLELNGIWIITVSDKETGKHLASTGSTGLSPLLEILERPFNLSPWK